MRFLPYLLIVLLSAVTVLAVVTRPEGITPGPSLAEKINTACKPWLVDDWWILEQHPEFLRVSCYDPKTSKLRYTMVVR
jgi:hypothetical protein